MNRKAWNAAILASMLLAAPALGAETRARVAQNERTTSRANQNQKVIAFKTDRTDSWLCENVSVFFCTDLFPRLNTTQNGPGSPASLVPDRSRTPGR